MARTARRRRARRASPPASPARPRALPPPLAARILGCLPALAVLVLLWPYLWPLDRAPTAEFSDIRHQHLPYVQLLADGLRRDGVPPRWNPQDFAGVPTVGDPQAGTYNPLYWLLALHPSGHGFGLLIVGYAVAGTLGFQLYARDRGLSPAAAAAGAVMFVLGGSLLMRMVVPGHVVFGPVVAIPPLLWVVGRLGAAAHPGRIAVGAVLVAFLIVALHPQALLYAAILGGVLALVDVAASPRPRHALAALAATGTLGVALASVHLLPIFELADEFSRAQPAFADAARGLDARPGLAWLATMIHGGTAEGLAWEVHAYVGGVGLFLAAVGAFAWPRRNQRRALARIHGALVLALIAVACGPSAGGPFRIPTRALVLLGLPLGMLTALGVDALVAAPPRRRAAVTGSAWAGALLLVLTGADATPLLLLLAAGGGALLLGAAAATSGAAGGARAPVPAAAVLGPACLVAVLALDLGRIVRPWVRTTPEASLYAPAAGVTLPPDVDEAFRIAELERGALTPGLPEPAVRHRRLETLAGANPLLPWRFVLFAGAAAGFDPFAHHFDIAVPLLEVAEPRLFDLLGVTHLLRPRGEDPPTWEWQRRPTALPRAYLAPGPIVVGEGAADDPVAAEIEALRRLTTLDPHHAVLLHGPAAITELARAGIVAATPLAPFRAIAPAEWSAHQIRLDVTLHTPGILVVNAPFFRGWRAWDNGVEGTIVRANVLSRGLVLDAGRHRLRLAFTPRSWVWGRRVSALACGILMGLALLALRRRGFRPRVPSFP